MELEVSPSLAVTVLILGINFALKSYRTIESVLWQWAKE
jgi:hypothetical protein